MQKYRFFYVSNPADHFQLIEQQMKTSQTTPYITILVAFKFPEMQLIERIFRTILNANIRSKHHLVCMSLKTAIANYGILTFSLPNVLDPLLLRETERAGPKTIDLRRCYIN